MLFITNVREQLQTATVATRSSSECEHFYALHCRLRLSRKKTCCSTKLPRVALANTNKLQRVDPVHEHKLKRVALANVSKRMYYDPDAPAYGSFVSIAVIDTYKVLDSIQTAD